MWTLARQRSAGPWALGNRPPLIGRFDEESLEVVEGRPRFAGSVFLKDVSALTREQVFVAGSSRVPGHRPVGDGWGIERACGGRKD